ncbi:MAG: glycosyltransferase family 8 protein [Eubacterium sp.]|nr:glycosyltransferase family 8 protein [Eubacterium sp.]
MEKTLIPIFFTIDDGYAPYLGVAIKSLIENASKDYRYRIHIIQEGLTDKYKGYLADMATEDCEIEFCEMRRELDIGSDFDGHKLRADYFTLTIYYRLFIPEMFPEYDKVIYIDSDVVVPGDISELYNEELGDNLVGACTDTSILHIPPLVEYTRDAVGMKPGEYCNSGILLMNAKKMREVRMDEHFLALLNKYQFDTVAPDQDYLNAMCNGQIKHLSDRYDVMPVEDAEDKEDIVIIHYNLFSKPWLFDNIQYGDIFWEYAKKTEFYEDLKEIKNTYTEEQKAHDMASMENLVTRATMITGQDKTFKKVQDEEGVVRL